jgi:hypothetical protein
VHLVILVVRPWPDRAFNHLTNGFDRFAFPDADAKCVIVGSRMDWQRNVGRKPSFERLGLGGLKAFGVVNSVDDCNEHGFTVPSLRFLRESAAPCLAHPIMARSGASEHHHFAATGSPGPGVCEQRATRAGPVLKRSAMV